MQAITVLELKGFTEISDSLALKMDEVNLTTERVRVGTINLVRNLVAQLKKTFPTNDDQYIGGDTLFITFDDIDLDSLLPSPENQLKFSSSVTFHEKMMVNGIERNPIIA